MDQKQPNIPENERGASFKKRPKKKLSTGQRIYRAIYTFFYVAAQLIRECALFLYEKGKTVALATASFFRQTLASLKASKEPKDDKAVLEKKREMPETQGARQSPMTREGDKKKAAPAKKHLSPFARKEKQYAEKDYLDFEEEPIGKRNKKKNKKKELPTFEEALLYEEEKKQRRGALAKKAAVRFLSVALGLQLLSMAMFAGLYIYTGNSLSIGSVEVHFKEGGHTKRYSVSKKTGLTTDGRPKVDMNALAAFLELETVSDRNYVYYTLTDGKRIVLLKNSKTAILDGSRVTLSEEVIFSGKRVYAPVELIAEYTEGIGVSYSEKEDRLTLTRQKDKDLSNSREEVYKEWRLTVSAIEKAPIPQFEMSDKES